MFQKGCNRNEDLNFMKNFLILFCFFLIQLTCSGQIYTPGKDFVFDVQYYQSDHKITTNEIISLSITGRNWSDTQDQKEAIWNYQSNPKPKSQFKDHFSLGWTKYDTTGFIENDKKLWLHPPRHNQYTFNEIAPFPDFRRNLKAGDTYQSILYIGNGFGEWTGGKIRCTYEILRKDQDSADTVWTISAKSEFDGKTNILKMIFSEKRGFILMDYSFFNGDKETVKLKE